jgi:hypothetical protein
LKPDDDILPESSLDFSKQICSLFAEMSPKPALVEDWGVQTAAYAPASFQESNLPG